MVSPWRQLNYLCNTIIRQLNLLLLRLMVRSSDARGLAAKILRPASLAAASQLAYSPDPSMVTMAIATLLAVVLDVHVPLGRCRIISACLAFGMPLPSCSHPLILSGFAFVFPSFPQAESSIPSSPVANVGRRGPRSTPRRQWRPRLASPSRIAGHSFSLLRISTPPPVMDVDSG
eukprot:2800878-Karenia_brevis.AAC.1